MRESGAGVRHTFRLGDANPTNEDCGAFARRDAGDTYVDKSIDAICDRHETDNREAVLRTTRIPLSSSGSTARARVNEYSWWAEEKARPRKESGSRGLARTLSLAPSANDAIMLSDSVPDRP